MDHRCNFRTKTTKFLEENICVNLYDPGLSNGFLGMTPKQWQPKKKNILDFLKIELLYFKGHYQESEKIIHRMGENIYKLHLISDLYLEYIKESYNS